MLTVGSLFSGIGGLDLGFERAGFQIRWQCEADEFCRRALKKHWPDVPCHPDVRQLHAGNVEPVDVLIGGFPCQDVSDAGLRTGIDGARSGLWGEYARLIRELRTHGLRAVAIENVSGLFARGFDRVLGDLAALGFDAEWEVIRASDVGAPHRRARIFIVAHAQLHTGGDEQQRLERWPTSNRQITGEASAGRLADAADGLRRSDRGTVERSARTSGPETPHGSVREGLRHAVDDGSAASRRPNSMADADIRRRSEHSATHDDDRRDAPGHDADGCDPRELADAAGVLEGQSREQRTWNHAARLRGATGTAQAPLADAGRRGRGESDESRDAARLGAGLADAESSGGRFGLRESDATGQRRRRPADDDQQDRTEGLADAGCVYGDRRPHQRETDQRHGADARRPQASSEHRDDRSPFWPARPGEQQHNWEPPRCLESSVGRRPDGLPRGLAGWRRAALQAFGNAVVPQVAEVVAWRVRELLK